MGVIQNRASVIEACEHYLQQLAHLIDLGEAHCLSSGMDGHHVLSARLAPDMLPFETQVEIAANFALRVCFPLAGQRVPAYGEFPSGFDGLRERLHDVQARLRTLLNDETPRWPDEALSMDAGKVSVSLPVDQFLFNLGYPNFMFHIVIAYAILRTLGVSAGKHDFDGYHIY